MLTKPQFGLLLCKWWMPNTVPPDYPWPLLKRHLWYHQNWVRYTIFSVVDMEDFSVCTLSRGVGKYITTSCDGSTFRLPRFIFCRFLQIFLNPKSPLIWVTIPDLRKEAFLGRFSKRFFARLAQVLIYSHGWIWVSIHRFLHCAGFKSPPSTSSGVVTLSETRILIKNGNWRHIVATFAEIRHRNMW